MFQTQTKWKLGALFFVAPLLVTSPIRADESEQAPMTSHHEQRIDVKDFSDFLRKVGTLHSADGDVYHFEKDGTFSYQRGKKSAEGIAYVNDYGRFTVKKKVDTGNQPSGSNNVLVLDIAKADEQSSGKIVPRTDMRYLDIEAMFTPEVTQGSLQKVSLIYVLIGGKRFDQGRTSE